MQENRKIRNKELAEKRNTKTDNKREKKIKAGLGVITYNFRDNTVSIPNEVSTAKIAKIIDINNVKTIIGVDLGLNNTAVMCAIDISTTSMKYVKGLKSLSLKELPNVKILKFKYVSGFENNHKMKQLQKLENKRRKLRKDVGHRRENLKEFTNHRVSSIIADFSSQFPNPIVIFENNLANLKNYTWSPADVRTKCDYKLAKYCIKAFDIHPAYTSQICHRCGAIGIRTVGSVHFKCLSCGLGVSSNLTSAIGLYNADGNASVNIALRGLYVLTRKEETVERTDGYVAEPNTHPNDNARETIPQVISEAFDGTAYVAVCKDAQSFTGETILGIAKGEKSNLTVEIHREAELQKSDFLPIISKKIIFQEEQNKQKIHYRRCAVKELVPTNVRMQRMQQSSYRQDLLGLGGLFEKEKTLFIYEIQD